MAISPSSDAASRADPEIAIARDEQRADEIVGQALGGGVELPAPALKEVQTIGRSHPQARQAGAMTGSSLMSGSCATRREGQHGVTDQGLFRGVGVDGVVGEIDLAQASSIG